jgi:putative transposase
MDSTRAYKFRLYPDVKRQSEIDKRLIIAQKLYNKLLEKTIASYKEKRTKVSMSQLNRFLKEIIAEDKSYLQLYSQTRQEIFIRIQKAYKNFFRRLRSKSKKVGFPRFKSKDRYNSLTYPQDNGSFTIEKGRLRVSRIGTMRIEQHKTIEGTVKTLTIKKEGRDYYAIFTVIKKVEPPEIKNINPVGIDLGLTNFIALSDGKTIQKPKFFKKKEKRIAKWQKIVARRNKGSKRRDNARSRLQEEWRDVTRQSNDFIHKLSDILVKSGYTSFVVEKLQIQNMTKSHRLAQSIQYASWNRFVNFLSYKAESAGMKVTEVNPKDTTKECSSCGNIKDMPLDERIYICDNCGLQMDRDVNAAMNILKRAREGHSRSHAQGDSVRPQKEARIEELRTYSATKSKIQVAGEANDL